MNMTRKDDTVLVTGGSGYVGSSLIEALLRQGYRVRTTLRSLTRAEEVRAWVAGALEPGSADPDRLSFYAADLLSDGGWLDAAEGSRYVLHVASPLGQGVPKGTDLVTPAREGTLRVLRASATAGVERVVYTSSLIAAHAAAVPGLIRQPRIDEETWTDPDARGLGEYGRSKTLAERAAWQFLEENGSGMTLATVLPGLIVGPVLTKNVSGSVEIVSRLLAGKVPALPRIGFATTDMRDLAELHILAMTAPEAANERFIGVGDFLWLADIARILREHYPAYAAKIPTRRLPDFVIRLAAPFQEEARFMAPQLGIQREFSSAKSARLLRWQPRPAEEAVLACAESLIRRGAV